MSTVPATYTLYIPQRASLSETIRVPYDGTDVEVYASVWDSDARKRKYLDLTVTWVDRYEEWDPEDPTAIRATFTLSADWEDTKRVTKSGYWDLLWVWPDGLRDYILQGPATVDLNATEEPAP